MDTFGAGNVDFRNVDESLHFRAVAPYTLHKETASDNAQVYRNVCGIPSKDELIYVSAD